MKQSESSAKLAKALALAQGEFLPIEKNQTGKVMTEKASFSYDYADLSDVLKAVRPALAKYEICLSHDAEVKFDTVDGEHGPEQVMVVYVSARIQHGDEWRESTPLPIPCEGRMGRAQLIGSADTYGRRYTTCDILGVVAQSDDDGTQASGTQSETSRRDRPVMPVCPECGKSDGVIVGKQEYGGGFVCYKAKGGCGHKWHADEKPQQAASSPEPTAKAKSSSKTSEKQATDPDQMRAEGANVREETAKAVAELIASINANNDRDRLTALVAQAKTLKPRMTDEEYQSMKRCIDAADNRIIKSDQAVPTAPADSLADQLSRRANATSDPKELAQLLNEVAVACAAKTIEQHAADALTGMIGEKIKAASPSGDSPLVDSYLKRIDATAAKAGLCNAILDDIAADVAAKNMTGDESEKLNELVSAKMASA